MYPKSLDEIFKEQVEEVCNKLNKYKCKKCNQPDEDNSLRIIVEKSGKEIYEITYDGKITQIDDEGIIRRIIFRVSCMWYKIRI